jgi:hypothetical protein
VNKYSKFQMDTFASFWENLTDPDADADADADDNSSTFFLRKVGLKMSKTDPIEKPGLNSGVRESFSIVLVHWNNSPLVDMALHSGPISWFRVSQCLRFLLNTACLAEKQHIPIL